MISEIIQPAVHDQPGNRESDEDGQGHEPKEILRDHNHDTTDGGADDFPDANLLLPFLGGECCQSEKTEAGDQDCQSGNVTGKNGYPLFGDIKRFIGLIDKTIVERNTGIIRFVKSGQAGQNGLFPSRRYLYKKRYFLSDAAGRSRVLSAHKGI